MVRRFGAAALVLVAVGSLVLTGCASDERPSPDEWQPVWLSMTNLMPSATELGDPPDRPTCSAALGEIRSARSELFPTPDAAIEPVVREWVRVAEDALFECPPSSSALPDLAAVYADLARLEAEVSTVLQIDLQS